MKQFILSSKYCIINLSRQHLKLRKNVFIFLSILKSMNLAAYHVLWIKFLHFFFFPLDYFLSVIEKFFLKSDIDFKYPIVFVVGIQRTGSTFVSQVLADTFMFAPLGNLATIFSRSRYYIHRLFSIFYPKLTGQAIRKRRRKYRSYYGISKGIFTISDSYEVWDKWFGNDHYTMPESLPQEKIQDMKNYFTCFEKAYNKPVITKNNRNTLAITLLNEVFPNAFFVIVERNPEEVIQSTVQASYDFFGKAGYLWGLKPYSDFDPGNYKDLVEAACHQYVELKKNLSRQLTEIDQRSYIIVNYHDFCENPGENQKRIVDMINQKSGLSLGVIKFEQNPFRRSERLDNKALHEKVKNTLARILNNP